MDRLTKERRSWNMSRIRGTNTKPEMAVRSLLHKLRFRFRLHLKTLPGKPDIVLPRYGAVIFIHGCFWHRHSGCKFAYSPKSRQEFWEGKFLQNVVRHEIACRTLEKKGWRILVIWECEVSDLQAVQERLVSFLSSAVNEHIS
ncbi:MAG: DNA mismatch endonuclease Vsr [Syntrophobacteraceae bacterium]